MTPFLQVERSQVNVIHCLRRLVAALAVVAATASGAAEMFPSRPVTVVVGFAPGGAADVVARHLAEEMGKQLGQRVVIDNKSGAGGNIATQAVVNAPADGYTLLFAAINLATNPELLGVKYDPSKDLAMVSQITSVPVIMLTPGSGPLTSPADVIAASQRNAGGLKVGSGGSGTSSHLAMELFSRSQKVPFVHIPYRGGAPANQALMSGEIDLMFDLMSGGLKSLVDAGRVRAIAVMQERRIPTLPNVKSAEELGLPASTHIRSWQGIAVRGGTSAATINRLHAAVVAAARSQEFAAKVEQLGYTVVTSETPEAFQKHYLNELGRWSALIKAANIKAE